MYVVMGKLHHYMMDNKRRTSSGTDSENTLVAIYWDIER